jgi:YafQ family addiction module toxin component
MSYSLEINPSCQENIRKHCKKNPVLASALNKKIEEILLNPSHYKPLRYDLAGERRVHILKSFVLIYSISAQTVTLVSFGHHDDAYGR